MTCRTKTVDEIQAEWNAIVRTWEDMRLQWSDPVANRFQRDYINQWQDCMHTLFATAAAYVDDLDRAVDATSDCRD